MTTQTDYLGLIKTAIDTQYDLARIELFRPFEIFDRYHGLKTSSVPTHECGTPRQVAFDSKSVGQFALPAHEWDALIVRLHPFDEAAGGLLMRKGPLQVSRDVFRNEAACACGERVVVVYSVRVSILWNGRTLMREYLLPEATEMRDTKRTKEG